MEHDKAKNLLQEFLDGELDKASADAISRHLDDCFACADEFEKLEGFIQSADALPSEIEPGQDLWAGIAKRLEDGDADHPAESRSDGISSIRPFWRRPLTLIAAAAALALLVLATNRFLDDENRLDGLKLPGTQTGALDLLASGTIDALEAETRAADPGVDAYVAMESDESVEGMSPLIDNLQIVNKAIVQARQAWKANPENSHLARMLISAYQAKLTLQEQVGRIAQRT